MYRKFEFTDYIEPERVEAEWLNNRPAILQELVDHGVSNPLPGYARAYWESKVSAEWHRRYMIEWLYYKTGRIALGDVDAKTAIECCKIHLEANLINSFDNCDFAENYQGGKVQLKAVFATNFCTNCLIKPIAGSESTKYCARCYREVLNKWRPL